MITNSDYNDIYLRVMIYGHDFTYLLSITPPQTFEDVRFSTGRRKLASEKIYDTTDLIGRRLAGALEDDGQYLRISI